MAYIKGPDFPTGGMIVHRPEKEDTEKIFPKVDISQIALRQRTGTPLLYKFRFCGQLSFFKRIFAFNLAFIIAFSVVRRGVISDGKARTPFIVEPDISFHNFLEVLFSLHLSIPKSIVNSSFIQPFRASFTGLSVGFPALDIERIMFVSLISSL